MYCTKCGQRNPDGASFCYHCGARIQTSDDALPADASLAAPAPPPASVSPWGADATRQQMAPGGQRSSVTTPLPHSAPDDPRTSPPVPPAWGYAQTPPAYPQMPPPPPIYLQAPAPPPPPPAWGDTLATSRGYVGMAGYGYAPQAAQAPRYAGFWRRFFALWIDSFVLGIIVGPIYAIAGGGGVALFSAANSERAMADAVTASSGIMVLLSLVIMPLMVLYFCIMESSGAQGTLGKLILGIKVTDLAGQRISFGKALGRNLAKLLSSMILSIGYLMAAFTERKQALHDIVAGCLVVSK